MGRFFKKLKIKNFLICFFIILILITAMALYVLYNTSHIQSAEKEKGAKEYEYHFAMIHSGTSDAFWEALYEGAQKEGDKVGAYVEDFGNTVPGDYTSEELLEMAIAARVDGIVVEGNRSAYMKELINQAEDAGITVVTMLYDVADSERKSHIGVNAYSLGELYGNQAVEALERRQKEGQEGAKKEPLKVTVILDQSSQGGNTSLVVSKIKDTITESIDQAQITELNIERNEDFEAEEDIRNMVIDPGARPDVIVCLGSVDTITCSQIITDHNLVGKIDIIGYYSAPEVLEGIQKGIIKSSVNVDARTMGETCIKYMDKYVIKGYVNEFVSVDTELITKDNVESYLKKDAGN